MAVSSYRVFLSHSGKDKEFVRELYRRLVRDGVSCFFDIESIGWGDNWVRALERALDECEYVVFVLSPDFCNSKWAEVERTSSIAEDPSVWKDKVRPLLLRPCRDLPTFPRFLRPVQHIDVSSGSLFEQNYPRICQELGGVVRPGFTAADKGKLPPVHPLPVRYRMPHHSLGDKFVGRVGAIWQLYDSLFRDSTTVLQGTGVVAGTGGLGKTQLAIEYAHRFGSVYTGGVYWVKAELGITALITQICGAAGIEVDARAEEEEQVAQIWHGLNSRSLPCLVVLDNFPENVALRPYLPPTGRVHTIVTTRRQDLGHATVRLPALSMEESVQLLNSGDRRFGQSAEKLAERLGGLPLALELSKSYLNYRKDLSVPALIEEMGRAGELSLLTEFSLEYRDQLPSRHELDVAATFQLSWDIAPDPAKQVLRVMGELAPALVPRRLLRTVLNWPEQPALRDELSKALSELARLSLVDPSSSVDPLAHRLILAFARRRNVVDHSSPFDRCREVLLEQMRRANENPGANTNAELELLLPHAEFLAASDQLSFNDFGDLLSFVGIHHQTMGRFTAARHAFSRVLGSAERLFEPGHPSIAIRQSDLAVVLQDLGQLEEARDLLRKALDSAEKSFDPGHPSIAISQSNLAMVLQDLGQLDEARDLLRKARASDEKSFEPGHPSIARSQSNLAMVLKDLGQLEEACDLLRKAYSASLERYGADYPATKKIKGNIDSLPSSKAAAEGGK